LNRAVWTLVDISELIERGNGDSLIEPIKALEQKFNEDEISTSKILWATWSEIKDLSEVSAAI
jgi:hypothetical protein